MPVTPNAFDFDLSIDDDRPMARGRAAPSEISNLRTAEQLAAQYPKWVRGMACPEAKCDGQLVLKDGKFGIFYGCTNYRITGCKGSHNCHKDTAQPHGRPADQATKDKRKEAHDIFDVLWKTGDMSRDAAYGWLTTTLGLSEEDGHIGMMDIAMCNRLIQAVKRKLGEVTRFERLDEDDII